MPHRYQVFFVKDRIDKGEVRVEYCNTELMLADYFTKTLQGRLFHKFWDVIMGFKHISTLKKGLQIDANKERVEHTVQNISTNCEDKNKFSVTDKRVRFKFQRGAEALKHGSIGSVKYQNISHMKHS